MRKKNRGKYRYKLHLLTAEHQLYWFAANEIRREIDAQIIAKIHSPMV